MAYIVRYYIDGVLQNYRPRLPDIGQTIKLSNTAAIGKDDSIYRVESKAEAWGIIRTQEEIVDSHNEWILSNKSVVTDDNGEYLTDDNGIYIYTD